MIRGACTETVYQRVCLTFEPEIVCHQELLSRTKCNLSKQKNLFDFFKCSEH